MYFKNENQNQQLNIESNTYPSIYHIQQYFSLMREVYCGVRYEAPLKKMVEDVCFGSSVAWLEDRIQVK